MRPVLPKATRYPRYSLEKVLCKPIVVHTPVHASWRNHVDISWAIIPRKVLTPHDFARVEDVEPRLRLYAQLSNQQGVAAANAGKFTVS